VVWGVCVCVCSVCCSFGTPTPTQVSLDPVEGKCILITGHDMHDLHELLKQTEGKVRNGQCPTLSPTTTSPQAIGQRQVLSM